jgi:hypothetical protein
MDEPGVSSSSRGNLFSHHSPRTILFSGLVLIAVLIVAAWIPIQDDYLWHRAYAVFELRNVHLTEGNSEPIAPAKFGFGGIMPYTVKGASGILGDFAEAHGTRIAVMRASASEAAQVYELAPAKRTLSSGSGAKALAAVSPDGTLAAYSVASTSEFAPNLSAWNVRLVDLSTGLDVDLGPGLGAEFFVRDGKTWLMYTSAAGITVTDVKKLTSFTTPFDFGDRVGFVAKISPNGKYIAIRDRATRNFSVYEVYRMASDVPLGIRPLPAVVQEADDIALLNNAAHTLGFAEGRVTVRKVPYTGKTNGEVFYTFPAGGPYFFIP